MHSKVLCKFMSSFDGIEVENFSLLVLLNPYLSTFGINTELDQRDIFSWTILLRKSVYLSVDRIVYSL